MLCIPKFIVLGLAVAAATVSATFAQNAPGPVPKQKARALPGSDLLWYDIRDLGVEGRGWNDTESFYDRLPARVKAKAAELLWNKSLLTAGMSVRFVTDANSISARWTFRKVMKNGAPVGLLGATEPVPGIRPDSLGVPHMSANAASGVDLYVRHEGAWRHLGVGWATESLTNMWPVAANLDPGRREYQLYLPLFNGVDEALIGIPRDATLSPAPPYPAGKTKPILFYGTSITHGGCVSRAGMAYPSILGRRLGRPIINLGFSGSGIIQPEIAEVMPEIDASVFLIDALPNLTAQLVAERMAPLVRALRKAHPETPIILAEDRTITTAFVTKSWREYHAANRAALRKTFEALKAEGFRKLYYIEGEQQLGADGEATADTSHPTDLGMMRIADCYEPVLRAALGEPAAR